MDVLVDELWEGRPGPLGGDLVREYVSRLRRRLDAPLAAEPDGTPKAMAVIETHPPGYVLHLESDELDSDRFVTATASGRAAAGRGDLAGAAPYLDEALGLCADRRSSTCPRRPG